MAARSPLDRNRIRMRPLDERVNRVRIRDDHVSPDGPPPALSGAVAEHIEIVAAAIRRARAAGRSVIATFGAHTIKNGLAPVLIRMLERGWLTHLATNGAGIIHDWEFAYAGESSEHVQENVSRGEFGHWEETGAHLNLALVVGAWEGRGYGESVGTFILQDGADLPGEETLAAAVRAALSGGAGEAAPGPGTSTPASPAPRDGERDETLARAAAALDLLAVMRSRGLGPGRIDVEHPFASFSVQAAACRLGVPFTAHPMFGHDIIYNHPMSHGAAIGRAAERDYLAFAGSVADIGDGGVYLSLGSAVMSPMIFEKSLSMARNLAAQEGGSVDGHLMVVVDLAAPQWDWSRGEPPESHPAYYDRTCKTFSRMGGTLRSVTADNREFLPGLCRALCAPA